jgi:hypothetical protein
MLMLIKKEKTWKIFLTEKNKFIYDILYMNLEYKDRYLKYKSKYLELKKQIGTGTLSKNDCEDIFKVCTKKNYDNRLKNKDRFLSNVCFEEFKKCQKQRREREREQQQQQPQNQTESSLVKEMKKIKEKAKKEQAEKAAANNFRPCDGKDGFCCYNWVKEFLISQGEIEKNDDIKRMKTQVIEKMDGTVKFINKFVEKRIVSDLYNIDPPCTKFDIVEWVRQNKH